MLRRLELGCDHICNECGFIFEDDRLVIKELQGDVLVGLVLLDAEDDVNKLGTFDLARVGLTQDLNVLEEADEALLYFRQLAQLLELEG